MALPLAPIIGASVGAISSLIGGSANRNATKKANAEERAWNERMFEKTNQRDIEFWKMQNAYNDPSAQMQRLGEAGLNPNLVYGNGATAQSGPIATHSAQSYNPRTPNFNEIGQVGQSAAGALDQIYNLQMKQAQIKQTEAQTQAIQLNSANREFLNRLNTPEMEAAMRETTPTKLYDEQTLRKGSMDIQSLDRMTKEATTRTAREMAGLFESGEKGANLWLQQAKQNLRNAAFRGDQSLIDNELKRLELDLNRKGLQKHDPIYLRVIGRLLTDVLGVDNFK